MDDFGDKFCSQGKYPLINGAKVYYLNQKVIRTTTNKPTSTTKLTTKTTQEITFKTTTTTKRQITISTTKLQTSTKELSTTIKTTSRASSNLCSNGNGYYPDLSTNCRKFYVCQFFGTSFHRIDYFDCPSGLMFDKTLLTCNYDYLVSC